MRSMNERRGHPRWAVAMGYVLLPWWGPFLAFGGVSAVVLLACLAAGAPVGPTVPTLALMTLLGAGTVTVLRRRTGSDWDEMFRRLRSGEPLSGEPPVD